MQRSARWLWLSAVVIAIDRATKLAIERYTTLFFRQAVVSDVVALVHSQNPGIAFGMFSESNSRWVAPLLLLSASAVVAFLVWALWTGRTGGALASAGTALILGGAAGNAFDRLIHGAVTDFIEVRLGTYLWPAFNVADSAISIGAALVLFELMFAGKREA